MVGLGHVKCSEPSVPTKAIEYVTNLRYGLTVGDSFAVSVVVDDFVVSVVVDSFAVSVVVDGFVIAGDCWRFSDCEGYCEFSFIFSISEGFRSFQLQFFGF